MIPNLMFPGGAGNSGQFFPRWTWEPVEAPEGELDFGMGASEGSGPGCDEG